MKYCFFRVDAYKKIGTGHLKRCIIIAYLLKMKNYDVAFITKETPQCVINQELRDKGFICFALSANTNNDNELYETLTIINKKRKNNPVILITDSDNDILYSSKYQKKIIGSGIFLMTITFKWQAYFYSHIIHNQNPLALTLNTEYVSESYSKRLFGPDYIVLKEEFLKFKRERAFEAPYKLLISFGGADPNNLTCRMLRYIRFINQYAKNISLINIVIGSLFTTKNELKKLLKNSKIPCKLFINTAEMPEIMDCSDIAITSGGLTVWELACLGIPNFVISTSEREMLTSQYLQKNKIIAYIGDVKESDLEHKFIRVLKNHLKNKQKLKALSEKSFKIVDGKGSQRLINEIEKLFKAE